MSTHRSVLILLGIHMSFEVASQSIGISAGVVHGTQTNIVQEHSKLGRNGEMIGFGSTVGIWFSTADTVVHFRVGISLERHQWKQDLQVIRQHAGYPYTFTGIMTKKIHFLRCSPALVIPVGIVQAYMKMDLMIPVSVHVTENFQGSTMNSSYKDAGSINMMNVGPGGGMRLLFFKRIEADLSIAMHLMDLTGAWKGRTVAPVFIRGELGYVIGRGALRSKRFGTSSS